MSVRTNTIKTTPHAHGLVDINRLTAVLAAGMKNMRVAPAPTDVKREYVHVSKLEEERAKELKKQAKLDRVIEITRLAAQRATKSAEEAYDASFDGGREWYEYEPGSKLYYKGKAAYDAQSAAADVMNATNLANAEEFMHVAELAAEIAALDTMPEGYLSRTPEEKAAYKKVKKGLMAAAKTKRDALKIKLNDKKKEDAKKARREKQEGYQEEQRKKRDETASKAEARARHFRR